MAAIPVVLNGTFTSDTGTTTGVFIGQLAYSDRGVGGGPVPPEGPVDPGYGKPGPVDPGYGIPGPPYPGKPPGDLGAHPEHPIYYPEPPTEPPPEGPVGSDGFIKSPPPGGGWGYHPQYAWMYDPGPEQAGPKG